MLIRETLQARVGGSRSETDLIDEVLKDVKQTGRGSSTRTCRARFTNCWSTPGNSPRPSNVQHTDITAISENWPDLKNGLAHQTQLIAKPAARVEYQNDALTKLTEQVDHQNEAIDQLVPVELAANEPVKKRRPFLRF